MGSRLNFAQSLDFEGSVAANGNPKVFLDGGPTIDELVLETNLAADEFTFLVEVNNDLRVKMTGTEMLAREAYDGRSATSGQFVFAFSNSLASTLQGEMMTGLCTKPTDRVVVSLEIASSVTPGSPTAVLYAETSAYRPEEFRLYCIPETVPITKTGENFFSGMRRGQYPAKHFVGRVFAYGAVSKLEIDQDRKAVFGKRGLAKAVNDARLKRNGKTVPADCYVYDPTVKGRVTRDMLDTFSIEYLRFNFTTTDSNDIRALVDYVHDVTPMQQAA